MTEVTNTGEGTTKYDVKVTRDGIVIIDDRNVSKPEEITDATGKVVSIIYIKGGTNEFTKVIFNIKDGDVVEIRQYT